MFSRLNDTHGSLTLGYALVFNHVAAAEDKMVDKVRPYLGPI